MGSERTQIKPGEIRNPNGRPKGTITKQKWLDNVLGDRKDDLLREAFEQAMSGKTAVMELLLSRWLPPAPLDETITINFEGCKTRMEKVQRVYEHLQDELITSVQALNLMNTIEKEAKIFEADELDRRLSALENKQK